MWVEHRNNKYRYSERYTDPMTGKLRKVSVTLERKADKKAILMLQELIADKLRPMTDFSLSEAIDMYLKEQAMSVKQSTLIRNESCLRSISDILGGCNRIDRLTATYIREKFLASGKSPRTLNEYINRFKAFLRWCYRHDIISTTACIDKMERFKDTPKRQRIQDKFLNGDELSAFLNTVSEEGNKLITEFLALSGLRIGELIALDDSDVTDVIRITKTFSPTTKMITSPKTLSSYRDVHIQPELADCIRRLRKFMQIRKIAAGVPFCPHFIISTTGNRQQYDAFNKWFRDNTDRIIGRKLSTHSLRHTHASLLMEAGYPLEAISRRLGHENSLITKQIYLHITEGTKKNDAAMMDNITLLLPKCSQK